MSDKSEDKKTEEKAKEKKSAEPKMSMPDLSGITDKFDLDKILGGIKSMISPEEGASMSADPNDALGMKIEKLSGLLKEISKTHAKLSEDFSKANDLWVGLFKDLEAIRAQKK